MEEKKNNEMNPLRQLIHKLRDEAYEKIEHLIVKSNEQTKEKKQKHDWGFLFFNNIGKRYDETSESYTAFDMVEICYYILYETFLSLTEDVGFNPKTDDDVSNILYNLLLDDIHQIGLKSKLLIDEQWLLDGFKQYREGLLETKDVQIRHESSRQDERVEKK